MKLFSAFALLLLFAATDLFAAPKIQEPEDPFEAQDPIKPVNQQIFNFNLSADRHVIKPVAQTYHMIPDTERHAINNFLSNLGEPANALNGVLQLDSELALTAFWRFALNTTFGIGGLSDFAGQTGLKNRDTSFDKTLGRYHVGQGPYIVLPIIGPSCARDTAGSAVDWFMDPVGWFTSTPVDIAQTVADGISTRDKDATVVDQFYYNSLEPYTASRAAYLQHQAFHH